MKICKAGGETYFSETARCLFDRKKSRQKALVLQTAVTLLLLTKRRSKVHTVVFFQKICRIPFCIERKEAISLLVWSNVGLESTYETFEMFFKNLKSRLLFSACVLFRLEWPKLQENFAFYILYFVGTWFLHASYFISNIVFYLHSTSLSFSKFHSRCLTYRLISCNY